MSAVALPMAKGYRFVWRNAGPKRQWFSKSFYDVVSPTEALAAMQAHLEKTLGKSLSAVVVDHYFYAVSLVSEGGDDSPMWTSDPISLRDFAHPFWYEFNNKVHPPGNASA